MDGSRGLFIYCWHSLVLGMESSLQFICVYLVYAERNDLLEEKCETM